MLGFLSSALGPGDPGHGDAGAPQSGFDVDSAHDFCPVSAPDSVAWIPGWGQGGAVEIVQRDGGPGVWLTRQPVEGLGALQISLGGRSEHVPVLASSERSVTYTMPRDFEGHEDVRIMGAFNGWSRTSHPSPFSPMARGPSTWC